MNRQIKFRAWNNETSKMIYNVAVSDSIGFHKGKHLPILNGDKNYILMQFTGLLDKYGNEIYEGDVLKMPFDSGIAYVINDGFMYCVKSPGSEAVDYETSDVFEASEMIGNIYDNQELISDATQE